MSYFKIIFLILLPLQWVFAEEGHHETGERFGANKAVIDYHKGKGFQLSKESIARLGIDFKKIDPDKIEIPESAIVYVQNKKGFFIYREKYFQFLEIDKQGRLKNGDSIVVKGLGLLSITDVFTKDQSEYGHSH